MSEIGNYNFHAHGQERPDEKIVRLQSFAKDPVEILKSNIEGRGLTIQDVLLGIGNLAEEFSRTLSKDQISRIDMDPDFVKIHEKILTDVDVPDFYEGMFSILKRVGYSRDEVKSFLESRKIDGNSVEGMKRQVSQNTALDIVYGLDSNADEFEVYE